MDAAIFGTVVGAAAAIAGGVITQVAAHHLQARTRWSEPLLEKASALSAAGRRLVTLSWQLGSIEPPAEGERVELLREIESLRDQISTLVEQIRLLGSLPVQEAARLVQHHVYASREIAYGRPDPRADIYPDASPTERANDALERFARVVRAQLGVPAADDVFIERRDSEGRIVLRGPG